MTEKEEMDFEPREEYDFSKGVRGHFVGRLSRASVAVVLEPEVAKVFPNSDAVNEVLRAVLEARKKEAA